MLLKDNTILNGYNGFYGNKTVFIVSDKKKRSITDARNAAKQIIRDFGTKKDYTKDNIETLAQKIYPTLIKATIEKKTIAAGPFAGKKYLVMKSENAQEITDASAVPEKSIILVLPGYDTKQYFKLARVALEKDKRLATFSVDISKLGPIASWNLLAFVTCNQKACGTFGTGCGKDCYVNKFWRLGGYFYESNNTLRAYADNTAYAILHLSDLEKEIDAFLTELENDPDRPNFFRIHSSGDFFSKAYYNMWIRLVEKHVKIQFLAFTKQFDVIDERPATMDNFSLRLSGGWNIEIPEHLKKLYPVSVCIETIDELLNGYILCPGNCETCLTCWNKNVNTAFLKH